MRNRIQIPLWESYFFGRTLPTTHHKSVSEHGCWVILLVAIPSFIMGYNRSLAHTPTLCFSRCSFARRVWVSCELGCTMRTRNPGSWICCEPGSLWRPHLCFDFCVFFFSVFSTLPSSLLYTLRRGTTNWVNPRKRNNKTGAAMGTGWGRLVL